MAAPKIFSADKTKKLNKINAIKKRIKDLGLGWLNTKNIPTNGKIDNIIAGMIKNQIPGIPDTTPDNTIKIAQMSEIERTRFNKIMKHYKLRNDIGGAIDYYNRYVLVLSAYKEDKVNDFWENAKLPNFINYDYITFFIVNWMQNHNSQSVVSRGNNFRSLSLRF